MRIRLHDIPDEGKTYIWTRETAEANASLRDLLGDRAYHAEFTIRPLTTKDYQLTGVIKSSFPELCSRCGIDFDFMLRARFREILIPPQEETRTGRYAKVNHLSDSPEAENSTCEYESDETFDMGEYLHEQVGLSIPVIPAPEVDSDGDCRACGIKTVGLKFGYEEEMPQEKPQSPFAALKNLKLE